MLKAVLRKASLGGIINMIRLDKVAGFEVQDANKTVLVIYSGAEGQGFSEDIGIFNLGLLLDMLSIVDDPKISYKDGILTIKAGSQSFEYMTADPSVIFTAYEPEKLQDHVMKKIEKAGKATVVKISAEAVQVILKGMSVLKDASVAFFEGNTFGIGNTNENSYKVKLLKDVEVPEKVLLPKKELQAILSVCEGVAEGKGKDKGSIITISIRGDGAPVVIKEQDLTFVLNRMEG